MTRQSGLPVAIGLSLLGAMAWAARPPAESHHLGTEPEHLPAMARAMLQTRMKNHRFDMQRLLDEVVRLNYDAAAKTAQLIAEDDRLARPLPDETELLNSVVPASFFELQEQLRNSSSQLAEAARERKTKLMGKAFADVAQTCVACHALYLEPAKN